MWNLAGRLPSLKINRNNICSWQSLCTQSNTVIQPRTPNPEPRTPKTETRQVKPAEKHKTEFPLPLSLLVRACVSSRPVAPLLHRCGVLRVRTPPTLPLPSVSYRQSPKRLLQSNTNPIPVCPTPDSRMPYTRRVYCAVRPLTKPHALYP